MTADLAGEHRLLWLFSMIKMRLSQNKEMEVAHLGERDTDVFLVVEKQRLDHIINVDRHV